MPTPPLSDELALLGARAVAEHGGVSQAARALGKPRNTVDGWYRTAIDRNMVRVSKTKAGQPRGAPRIAPAPVLAKRRPGVRYFLCTAAQDETLVHDGFWRNLTAFADHINAEILIGGFTYQKGLFEDHTVATGFFVPEVRAHLAAEKRDLAPGITWCGHANISPTATNPLSGWQTLTRDSWAIIPHARIALECVPVMPGQPSKQVISTGVVTVPNYVQKNAGQRAEFHHTIGATLVEVAADGDFFCRQITADRDGSFQDLDVVVRDGKISAGHRIEGATWGDIHREKLDPDIALGTWGFDVEQEITVSENNMLDMLRPRFQFFHDLLDFRVRNHHRRGDPHDRANLLATTDDDVEAEVARCARFLEATQRPWCQSVVVESNHDTALARWLKDPSAHADARNAGYWHKLNADWHAAIRRGDADTFNIFEHAVREKSGDGLDGVVFVPEGNTFSICQATDSPVECGLHGHIGANGARGSNANLRRVGPKINKAHSHAAAIMDGVFSAGLSGFLDQGYNKGLSSWSQSHILTLPSSKRTIVTMRGPRWRI